MRIVMVCLVGLVLSVGVGAEPVVEGRVRLVSGDAVVGAQVLVVDLADWRRYVVATTDGAGAFALSLEALEGFDRFSPRVGLPVGFRLGQNYPNPFNPSTVIPYELASGGYVRLEVFNLLGQRVAMLVDGAQGAGAHTAVWKASVSAGVYLYRLTVDGQQQTGRMVLVDGGPGFDQLSPRGDGGSLRAEPVEARTEAGDASYGLVVSGAGLVPYLDADFRLGAGPVEIELAAINAGRAKAVHTAEQALLGDVDGDGQITIFDAMLVMLFALNFSAPLPVEIEISLGDVDVDGWVTVGDAWLIATYLADSSDPAVASVRIGQPIDASGMMVVGETRSFSLPVAAGYAPLSMEFVWIPPGEFQMGSPEWEVGRASDEGPLHEVRLTRGFWLGKYEVTQGEWEAVMGHNPSYHKEDRRPVDRVSWNDVQAFIAKLNDAEGSALYRLPSEAEWEYACRAGTQTRWSLGKEDGDDASLLSKYAWYNCNDGCDTKAVGGKLPNGWGLYDMHGNVYEWVQDWYGAYNSVRRVDPEGASSGSGRVQRGGASSFRAQYVRSAYRYSYSPGYRNHYFGVRLVRLYNP